MKLPNLDFIRNLKIPGYPDFGARLHETFKAISTGTDQTEQQANLNPVGQPIAPPQINGLTVKGQNGHFAIEIQDNNEIYRGIRYYVEHDTNPQFTNPHPISINDSRTHHIFLGSDKRYWRAYSAYPWSGPSSAVYFGTSSSPIGVDGGGSIGGPAPITSQGSGTGLPRTGLQGPGLNQYRTTTGAPPQR